MIKKNKTAKNFLKLRKKKLKGSARTSQNEANKKKKRKIKKKMARNSQKKNR